MGRDRLPADEVPWLRPKVTVICQECGYRARRQLVRMYPGSRGVHETPQELGLCPHGHGKLVREVKKPKNKKHR